MDLSQVDLVVASRDGLPRRRCSSRHWRPGSPSGARSSWPGRCARPRGRHVRALAGRHGHERQDDHGRDALLDPDRRRLRSAAVGNVGTPVVTAVLDPDLDVLAVELSSFQLHFTHSMSAQAAAVLNVAVDHIDWHGSFDAYAADKGRVYERAQVACVYNVADPRTEQLVREADVIEGPGPLGSRSAPRPSAARGDRGRPRGPCFHADPADPARHRSAQELATFADLAHLAARTTWCPSTWWPTPSRPRRSPGPTG
ncbi:Mur ligase family protein [Oerskovia sp. M15]